MVAVGRLAPNPGTPKSRLRGKPGTNDPPFFRKAGERRFLPRADVTAADAAAAGDSRRAGEPSSPAAGSPPASYLPRAFPDELTHRERHRQPLQQAKCQGKSGGGSSPAPSARSGSDLGTEIQAATSAHPARAAAPAVVTLTLPSPEHGVPTVML